MVVRSSPLILLVGACGGPTFFVGAPVCSTTSAEPPIGVDEPSSLGFTGREVLDVLQLEFGLDAFDPDGSATPQVLTFTVEPGGSAWVEQREGAGLADLCPAGDLLVVPATLHVQGAGGWFSGSGPATVLAQSADPRFVWLEAYFDVAPSTELLDFALSEWWGDRCASPTMQFSQGSRPSEPWSVGPSGGLSLMCTMGDLTQEAIVYAWGPRAASGAASP